MKVKSESEVAQSCPTSSDPMDCGLQGSSIHGIFQARVLEWGAIASPPGIHSRTYFLEQKEPLFIYSMNNHPRASGLKRGGQGSSR